VNISHIKPYQETLSGQPKVRPDAIEVDQEGEEQFEVEFIAASRLKNRKLEYLVHWRGYDETDHTWESADIINTAPLAVANFHKKNPSAPRKLRGLTISSFASLFTPFENFTETIPS
ncbi:chromo domain-like protein, partial [Lanmaoa asiatica]